MKITDDSDLIKSRLKRYNPALVGSKMAGPKDYDINVLNKLVDKFISSKSDTERTQLLLDLSDEIRIQEGIPAYSVCQQGCAHCCKIPVSVTAVEAILIGEYTGKKAKEIIEIEPALDKYDYCPFLNRSTASCSIYKVRPLHCRNFHSLDHYDYCKTLEVDHLIFMTTSNERLTDLLDMLITASKGYSADIREWF